MSQAMPPLFQQILSQSKFQKTYDSQLELQAKVSKTEAERDALFANGLTMKEIEQGSDVGVDILKFLKEHKQKMKDKANLKKEIDRAEKKLEEVRKEIYGPPVTFIEQKVLLDQKVPFFERSKEPSNIGKGAAVKFEGMQTRQQHSKPGHRGVCADSSAKIRTDEMTSSEYRAQVTKARTDIGQVRIDKSIGRQKDYLIKNNERYRNIMR